MSARNEHKAVIYCDGASRGNPGEAAAGVAIRDQYGASLGTVSLYLGRQTNNQAEYAALLAGVLSAQILGLTDIEFRLDSELVVKQMNGEYKIKKRISEAARGSRQGSGGAAVAFDRLGARPREVRARSEGCQSGSRRAGQRSAGRAPEPLTRGTAVWRLCQG